MFNFIKKRLSTTLAVRVLIGAFFGIVFGLIFGNYCAILAPVGSAYVMMLQAAVYPYIICLVLLGIGRLSREKGFRLFRQSWPFYVTAFASTLAVMWLLHMGLPSASPPTAVDFTKPPSDGTDLLLILISANVFESLARDYLPGVIVFAVVFAVSIQRTKGKTHFLRVIQVVQEGCSTIIKWVLS